MHIIGSQENSASGTARNHTRRGLLLALAAVGILCLPLGSAAQAASGPIYNPPPCYTSPGLCLYSEANGSLTTWSTWDVGPTPYYYSVFNETTGARLAVCGLGTSCTTPAGNGPPAGRCYTYVAYIAGYGYTNPPSNVQRTSSRLTLCQRLN